METELYRLEKSRGYPPGVGNCLRKKLRLKSVSDAEQIGNIQAQIRSESFSISQDDLGAERKGQAKLDAERKNRNIKKDKISGVRNMMGHVGGYSKAQQTGKK